MRKRLFSLGAAAALVFVAAPAAAEPATLGAGDELARHLSEILDDPGLAGAQAAVVVQEAETGAVVYERRGDERLLPASNTKLLTSAAAMEILGSSYRFATSVHTTGVQRGGMLRGDIYLRGEGDPTIMAEEYDALAAEVAASGVRVVSGAVHADDTWFDDIRLGREWAWEDEPFYYAAQISALTVAPDTDYDAGTVIVTVAPGAEPGDPVEVELTPPTEYVTVDNQAVTVDDGAGGVRIDRDRASNRLVVSGDVSVGGNPVRAWRSVWEPTGYAADVFHAALARHGVRVLGGTKLGTPTPASAVERARHESMPLDELLVPFMKLSNNGHAEVLTKAIGRAEAGEGSWPAGLAAIGDFLATHGLEVETHRQADGSGLSRWNLISADDFVTLLRALRDEEWFDAWYEALPVAGDPDRMVGGTLTNRMRDTAAEGNAAAKTGTLTSVSALSGYVTDADGRPLVFAILLNNHLGAVKAIEDRIVVALAEFSVDGAGALSTSVPEPATPSLPDDVECSWLKPVRC